MPRPNCTLDDVTQEFKGLNMGDHMIKEYVPATATDILQRQSINSLLGNAGHASPQEGDTLTSISDLFGLNNPRGSMFSSYGSPMQQQQQQSSGQLGTPPPPSLGYNQQMPSFRPDSPLTAQKSSYYCGWADTPQSSPATPPHYGRSDSTPLSAYQINQERAMAARRLMRASSYSESNSSTSPATPLGIFGSQTSPLDTTYSARNLLDLLLADPMMYKNPAASCIAEYTALDRAARFHRSGAALYDATCTWSGVLPKRSGKITGYSSKVFLGGVPWDITEEMLVSTFRHIGSIKVEWPGKEKQAQQPKGYVYVIFDSEKQVKHLLSLCSPAYGQENGDKDSYYYKISSRRMKSKDVQVIPWIINDTNYVRSTSQKLDPSKTVFVGALHGMLTAEGLATIMNDLFEGVVYAGIDTDKWKYPIGSGRVTFVNHRSFIKAVSAAFIDIKTAKFSKKVQVDPYLEDSLCSLCGVQQGPYFCREMVCFRYFCRNCWQMNHLNMISHKPLMRNSKRPIIGMSLRASHAN